MHHTSLPFEVLVPASDSVTIGHVTIVNCKALHTYQHTLSACPVPSKHRREAVWWGRNSLANIVISAHLHMTTDKDLC